ncbi:MAG: hypothetical protein U9R34_02680 [Nanoarchaeota archaeon]|nr:hypothetical protein [Nanoarchaeota archaeon]
MINVKQILLWVKGGITTLSLYLLMRFVINPLLDSMRTSSASHIITEIINAPILIISIPLLFLYSIIGFGLDAVFHTGIGYESLNAFPIGIIVMEVFNLFYFFFVGVFIVWIYGNIKKRK